LIKGAARFPNGPWSPSSDRFLQLSFCPRFSLANGPFALAICRSPGGSAEIGWDRLLTLFFYTVLIVPSGGMIYGQTFEFLRIDTHGGEISLEIKHVHWCLAGGMDDHRAVHAPNVWRMKPWSLITLPQPWKGLVSFIITSCWVHHRPCSCVKIAPPGWVMSCITSEKEPERIRFLWYHRRKIAGFT